MRMRTLMAAAVVGAFLAASMPAGAVLETNPWILGPDKVMNISHQGGENEAPSNVMFSFKESILKGADVLELDVHATKDGEIVVLHDATADRTTNGSGRIDQMTLAQVQALDAAHWFVPGLGTTHSRPASEYVYRGIALGQKTPPAGYAADDFRIPTLREVLTYFPDVRINIEIKNTIPDTLPYESTLAALLEEFGRDDDVIVVSFLDHATEMFKVFAPQVHTATATAETAVFKVSSGFDAPTDALPGAPNPRYKALQVPIVFEGIVVVTQDFVDDAHERGFAVHVWTINLRSEMEYLIGLGVDGIMTDVPTLLQQVLVENDVDI